MTNSMDSYEFTARLIEIRQAARYKKAHVKELFWNKEELALQKNIEEYRKASKTYKRPPSSHKKHAL